MGSAPQGTSAEPSHRPRCASPQHRRLTDLGAYGNLGDPASYNYGVPGITFFAFPNSEGKTDAQTLMEFLPGPPDCKYGGGTPIRQDAFKALFLQVWLNCRGTPNFVIRTGATPTGRTEIIFAQMNVTSQADLRSFLEGVLTFRFDPAAFDRWRASVRNQLPPAPPAPSS